MQDIQTTIINVIYLISAILFILGLKGLGHPKTAIKGNILGSMGMITAILATLLFIFFDPSEVNYDLIILGFIVGSLIGIFLAIKIKMTSMPELVALFNGFGGLASTLVAGAYFSEATDSFAKNQVHSNYLKQIILMIFSTIIGSITFFGSLIAFAKLYGLKFISDRPLRYSAEQMVKLIVLGIVLILTLIIVLDQPSMPYYWSLVIVSGVLGILLVMSIGGADMPVVIALLNSYSGIAAAATGFIILNNALIIAGSLVGASGIILTQIMCKAMNRSLKNVLFGGFGAIQTTQQTDTIYENKIKPVTADDVSIFLDSAQKIVIVPGYGMAVGQAQHAVKDLLDFLENKDIQVDFAIHPVAGRMPGHMNVLLAEVNIPYEKLLEMDDINPSLAQVDVAIVLGANDVVNPDARDNPNSPIAGMPIINIDHAKTVIVIKRSLSPGFAGIPNPLFTLDNVFMYFSDGKKAVLDILSALKSF